MMIGHDDINAEFLRKRYFFHIRDTTIDRDNECGAVCRKLFDRGRVQPVPLGMSMRNVIQKVSVADLSEEIMQNDRTGDAVTIIIPIDNNPLAICHGRQYPLDRTFHVKNEERVVGITLVIGVKKTLLFHETSYPSLLQESFGQGVEDFVSQHVPHTITSRKRAI